MIKFISKDNRIFIYGIIINVCLFCSGKIIEFYHKHQTELLSEVNTQYGNFKELLLIFSRQELKQILNQIHQTHSYQHQWIKTQVKKNNLELIDITVNKHSIKMSLKAELDTDVYNFIRTMQLNKALPYYIALHFDGIHNCVISKIYFKSTL